MPLPVGKPIIYDSVTLQHFAAAGSLSILERLHRDYPLPRWTEQVHHEVLAGTNMSKSAGFCRPVIELTWLDEPVQGVDLTMTLRLQALLSGSNDDPSRNLGEAESLAHAIACGGSFVTDDTGAYDFARNYYLFGANRVSDMCTLLWDALGANLLGRNEVTAVHTGVFDAGRTMRCRCSDWPGH